MTPLEIQWREPIRFAAGDTLSFYKKLPAYLPSNGWAVKLIVLQALPEGGAKQISLVVSAPDPTNSFHTFVVPQWLAGQPTGEYILVEEAVNAGNNNEQHRVYYDEHFVIGPNLAGGAAGQIKSRWELLLDAAVCKLAELEAQPFGEMDQQRNRFVIEQRESLLRRVQWYEAKVRNERQMEQARNGQPPDNQQGVVFSII